MESAIVEHLVAAGGAAAEGRRLRWVVFGESLSADRGCIEMVWPGLTDAHLTGDRHSPDRDRAAEPLDDYVGFADLVGDVGQIDEPTVMGLRGRRCALLSQIPTMTAPVALICHTGPPECTGNAGRHSGGEVLRPDESIAELPARDAGADSVGQIAFRVLMLAIPITGMPYMVACGGGRPELDQPVVVLEGIVGVSGAEHEVPDRTAGAVFEIAAAVFIAVAGGDAVGDSGCWFG